MFEDINKKLLYQGGHKLWTPRKKVHFNFGGQASMISGCGCCGGETICGFPMLWTATTAGYERFESTIGDCDYRFNDEDRVLTINFTLKTDDYTESGYDAQCSYDDYWDEETEQYIEAKFVTFRLESEPILARHLYGGSWHLEEIRREIVVSFVVTPITNTFIQGSISGLPIGRYMTQSFLDWMDGGGGYTQNDVDYVGIWGKSFSSNDEVYSYSDANNTSDYGPDYFSLDGASWSQNATARISSCDDYWTTQLDVNGTVSFAFAGGGF